jgi:para-nitrobenzyl esterase
MPNAVVTETTSGEVEGRSRGGALLFAGVPFAAPPTGVRRFRPPIPHDRWRGVRSARRFGPAAPQRPGIGITSAPLAWDEDCLTLNVCTPAIDDRARPVLVWIHGGAFRTGKGGIPWYDGTSFAVQGDIVTVSINYRLGALGFTDLTDLDASLETSGASGLLDQIAALEWVRDNIAYFGGDPGQVTIAGESAGAMSVGTLLGCPAARGLFHRAIAQSGAAHHTLSTDLAREVGRAFAETLGADGPKDLLEAPVEAILDAQEQVQQTLEARDRRNPDGIGGIPFQPARVSELLPSPPLEAIRGGLSDDVVLLCGTNLDETTLWGSRPFDDARLQRFARRYFGDAGDEAIETYRRGRPEASLAAISIAITTDHLFRIPAIRLCEAHGGASFKYLFSWASRAFEGQLGSTHALEIPFAFNNLRKPGVEAFIGPGQSPQPLADVMHAAWISFIRGGDPNEAPLPEEWPRYDPGRRPVMEFGDDVGLREDPHGEERSLWDGRR